MDGGSFGNWFCIAGRPRTHLVPSLHPPHITTKPYIIPSLTALSFLKPFERELTDRLRAPFKGALIRSPKDHTNIRILYYGPYQSPSVAHVSSVGAAELKQPNGFRKNSGQGDVCGWACTCEAESSKRKAYGLPTPPTGG